MNTLQKLDQHDVGILIDDSHGIYVYHATCCIARDFGWTGTMPNWKDFDDVVGACDEALQWMNDEFCEEGIRVDWHDGAIMVQTTEWWESDDDE